MRLYKLTDAQGYTRNRTFWDIGVTHEVTGVAKLCTSTVIHAYTNPLLAALMNPAHANYQNPKCFVVEGEITVSDSTKVGCQKLTVIDTFELPQVTTNQRVAFGILSALKEHKGAECPMAWYYRGSTKILKEFTGLITK